MKRKSIFLIISILICIFLVALVCSLYFNSNMPFSGVIVNAAEGEEAAVNLQDDNASINGSDEINKRVKQSLNLLVLGCDSTSGNTDTIMLVNLNTDTGTLNILSIPRDSRITNTKSSITKINSVYSAKGIDKTVETVKSLLGAEIDYYAVINTALFRKVIDILDGIDIEVPVDMKYDDKKQGLHINLKKGWNRLDGKKAEQFVRFRKSNIYDEKTAKYYDGSDLKRINAQHYFIKEIVRQKMKIRYITKLTKVADVVLKEIKTNIGVSDIAIIASKLANINYEKAKTFILPGEDIYKKDKTYYFASDKDKTKELISQYFDVYR
ncbi:MAG: LCP family protein [Clostridia bacterium]|nr:LCP family protein [Clostridia bacterium]